MKVASIEPSKLPSSEPLAVVLHSGTSQPRWYTEYRKFHSSSLAIRSEDVKYLVYVCSGTCGGIGDRLSGMISTFYVAVTLRRIFLIMHNNPFPLEATLRHNEIDWRCKNHLVGLTTQTVNMVDNTQREKLDEILEAHDTNTTVIYVHVNRFSLGMVTWKASADSAHNPLWGSMHRIHATDKHSKRLALDKAPNALSFAFHALFKFAHSVKERYDQHLRELNLLDAQTMHMPFIAIHGRLGGFSPKSVNTAEWSDPSRHKIQDVPVFINCAANLSQQISGIAREEIPLVVVSDNVAFKEEAVILDKRVRYLNVTLSHIDKSTLSAGNSVEILEQGNIDAFADRFTISRLNVSPVHKALSAVWQRL